MLVLSRRAGERIHIGDEIVVTVVATGRCKVRVGVEAPPSYVLLRQELAEAGAARRHEMHSTIDSLISPTNVRLQRSQSSGGLAINLELPAAIESFIGDEDCFRFIARTVARRIADQLIGTDLRKLAGPDSLLRGAK